MNFTDPYDSTVYPKGRKIDLKDYVEVKCHNTPYLHREVKITGIPWI
jgi:hypothetical protein